MKKIAVILIILLLAAVGALGYLYMTSNILVRYDTCIATDAVTQTEYFNQLKTQISEGTFIGTLFEHTDPGDADQYQFLTYTVVLDNRARLDATTAEISVTPLKGDILQVGDPEERLVPAGETTALSVTIMTGKGMHNVREATVTWYIWGLPFTEKVTLGK